jgi:hypothetical protein
MAGVSRVPSNYKLLGKHELTSSFSTSATHTTAQDDGLSVSISSLPSRVLRVTFTGHPYANGGAQGVAFRFVRGATTFGFFQTIALPINPPISYSFTKVFNGPATGATETFKVQILALTANTQVTSYADANFTRQLIVEDLGPQ